MKRREIKDTEEDKLNKKLKCSEITPYQYDWLIEGNDDHDDVPDDDNFYFINDLFINKDNKELCIHEKGSFDKVFWLDEIQEGKVFPPAYYSHLDEVFEKLITTFGLTSLAKYIIDNHYNDALFAQHRPIHYIYEVLKTDDITFKQKDEYVDYVLSIPDIFLHTLNQTGETLMILMIKNYFAEACKTKLALTVPDRLNYEMFERTRIKLLTTIKNRECRYNATAFYVLFYLRLIVTRENGERISIPPEILNILWDEWTPFFCKGCFCYIYRCAGCKTNHCECVKF